MKYKCGDDVDFMPLNVSQASVDVMERTFDNVNYRQFTAGHGKPSSVKGALYFDLWSTFPNRGSNREIIWS